MSCLNVFTGRICAFSLFYHLFKFIYVGIKRNYFLKSFSRLILENHGLSEELAVKKKVTCQRALRGFLQNEHFEFGFFDIFNAYLTGKSRKTEI